MSTVSSAISKELLRLSENDNCLVALKDLNPGSYLIDGDQELEVVDAIPAKHKVLTENLDKGAQVILYGVIVGRVKVDLPAGSWLNTSNLEHMADKVVLRPSDYEFDPPSATELFKGLTFEGYHRPEGKVGTANYWLFIPLVFCENRNLKEIDYALNTALGYREPSQYLSYTQALLDKEEGQFPISERRFRNIDGIKFLYHQGGCGGTRDDAESLLRLLAGYVHHPNVAGATILSLGCQHAQVSWFQRVQQELFPNSEKPVLYFEQQKMPSEEALIKAAISETLKELEVANQIARKPAPLSKLTVGLECGGSDGFSGISANPAVGLVSDILVSIGGTTILSEFPELNGVEQNIVDRCKRRDLAERFLDLQDKYEQAAQRVGSGFDRNPSPGNIKDGLVTDAIKSAGAAKKGGTALISDVLDFAEPVTEAGLNLLCTPGNDVESTTAMAGSGANLILFTTGLGTPTGNPITPVLKISSNTRLFERMSDIIDVDAGQIITGEKTLKEMAVVILEEIIRVASGHKSTKSTQLGQDDFIPWKRGVSL